MTDHKSKTKTRSDNKSVAARLAALENELLGKQAAADKKRQQINERESIRRANQSRFESEAKPLIKAAIDALVPPGWVLLSEDIHGKAGEPDVRRNVLRRFASDYVIRILPKPVAINEHWRTDAYQAPRIGPSSYYCIVIGKPRPSPVGVVDCPHCQGLGILEAPLSEMARSNGEAIRRRRAPRTAL